MTEIVSRPASLRHCKLASETGGRRVMVSSRSPQRSPSPPLGLPVRFPESGLSAQVLATSRKGWIAAGPLIRSIIDKQTHLAT